MAKKHAWTHMVFATLVMTIIMIFMRIFEDFVAEIFTSDPQDVAYIREVL